MAQGSKKKYTSKQKRKAHDIEKGYKKRGVSSKEAECRAWATVNKSDKGGRKKRGGAAGKSEANRVPVKVEEKAAAGNALGTLQQITTLRCFPGMSCYPKTVRKFSL